LLTAQSPKAKCFISFCVHCPVTNVPIAAMETDALLLQIQNCETTF